MSFAKFMLAYVVCFAVVVIGVTSYISWDIDRHDAVCEDLGYDKFDGYRGCEIVEYATDGYTVIDTKDIEVDFDKYWEDQKEEYVPCDEINDSKSWMKCFKNVAGYDK